MFLFSCETSDHVTICNHDSICEEDKGFINHAGFIKIDIQIQKIVKHPTSLSFLERKLLLQLFWEYGAYINKEFKKLFEDTARDISTEILTFDEWLKYTKVKDFSISEGTLVKEALVYFDGDIVLLDILYMGYNSIRKNDIPTGLPRLVEAKGKNFHLLSPASKTLRLASDQIYSPINLKKDESFNHEVVISLENNLKKIGCLAFQMYFIKSQFRKNFDEFKMNLRNKSEAVKKKPKNSKKGVKIAEKQPSTSEELKPDLPL
ncbi:unnamed protein product [Trifolium pratense]|uniref:Uncharacterized protein n=1 Tax=Trifolium pratense TaxID=57577 RepID=A0ACB0L0A7_TRIPR|nr:unnamed protein product [Trifolium pratense]